MRLGREPYQTRILRVPVAPKVQGVCLTGEATILEAGVVVGGFDPHAVAEIGVWRRLMASEAIEPIILFVTGDWTVRSRQALGAATPPSDRARTVLVEETDWRELAAPDRPERSFAAVVRADGHALLMVGPPTEEAWDLFRDTALSSLGRDEA